MCHWLLNIALSSDACCGITTIHLWVGLKHLPISDSGDGPKQITTVLPVTSDERPPRPARLGGTSSSRTYARSNPATNGHLPSLQIATHRGNRMESHTNFYGNGQENICKGEFVKNGKLLGSILNIFGFKNRITYWVLPYQSTLTTSYKVC